MTNNLEIFQDRCNNLIQIFKNIYYFDHVKITINDDAKMAPTNKDFRISDQQ